VQNVDYDDSSHHHAPQKTQVARDPVFSMRLDMNNFSEVLCSVCQVDNIHLLPPDFVESAFQSADRDSGGDIDVCEFIDWYSAFSFSEKMVGLTEASQEVRTLARRLETEVVAIERYKIAFEKFDLDGSGFIESEEFTNLVNLLLKAPHGYCLPNERVQSLWREADKDSSGYIDFEEFCEFYMKRFDQKDASERRYNFSDYYRSIRKVPLFPTEVPE